MSAAKAKKEADFSISSTYPDTNAVHRPRGPAAVYQSGDCRPISDGHERRLVWAAT